MNNIVDQDVINSIKNLNIHQVLNSWLSLLKHHHESSLDHFESNRNQLKRDRETIVGVSFSDCMIEHLYSKLQRLKQLFNKDKSKSITHLQILESIEPLVYNRYKQVINNKLQQSIIDKYNQLKNIPNYSKQLVTCSTYPSSQILQSRAIPDIKDIQDQLWSGKYGPSQALGQLNRLNHQFKNLQQLLITLKESNTKNQNYIISNYDLECLLKADFNNITDNQQILFNYIKSKEISIINFKNSSQIDISIIKKFNLDTIVILDLSGCNKIDYFEGTISTKLYFKSLIKIKFNNCNQLISIKINSPNLEYISTDNCKSLKELKIDSSLLRYISAENCISLRVLKIDSSMLKYISIENCKLLELLKIDLSSLKYCNFSGILSGSIQLQTLKLFNGCYTKRLEYLNISESDYGDKITINSISLKRLVMNSIKSLKEIELELPSIESFSIEGCESLNEITINSKSLKSLVIHPMKNLKEIKLELSSIESFSIQDCESLNEISITSKSLKHLIINSMKKLSRIKLQVPSIESFSFEDCESLDEISTIKNDKELNYSLWNVLKQMDLNRLKQMNITINMVAAKQIQTVSLLDYCFLVPNSGPFIIPYNAVDVYYYHKVSNEFSFYTNLLPNSKDLIISGDLPQHLYKEEIPSTIRNLYLYDTYMVNTSNLNLEYLVLGYGFKNEFTSDYQLPHAKRITIGETLHPLNTPTCFHNTRYKLISLEFDGYKYKFEAGGLPKVCNIYFGMLGEDSLVKGSIHPDQERISFKGGFKQIIILDILPKRVHYLDINTVEEFKFLPGSIPTSNLALLETKNFDWYNKITQYKSLSSNHLVIGTVYNIGCFQIHFNVYNLYRISSLKEPVDILHYWHHYAIPIIQGTIPQTIQYLYLLNLKHPLSVGSIPLSVTHLELCDGFNQQITKDIIPSSVKYLYIGNIEHPLNQHSIPKQVEVLALCPYFNFNLLSSNVIPSSIKTLVIMDSLIQSPVPLIIVVVVGSTFK